MDESHTRELENYGNKKAKAASLDEASSSFPSIEGKKSEIDRCDDDDDDDEGEEEFENDPLALFGTGIMMMILNKLDARSVARSRSVSRGWLSIASSDKIWASKDFVRITEIGILNGDPIQTCLLLSIWSGDSPSWERW